MTLMETHHTDSFDKGDVEYLLKRLSDYKDLYTDKLKDILNQYMTHRNFEKLHSELREIDSLIDKPFHQYWDINAQMAYLEVIYPV